MKVSNMPCAKDNKILGFPNFGSLPITNRPHIPEKPFLINPPVAQKARRGRDLLDLARTQMGPLKSSVVEFREGAGAELSSGRLCSEI